MMKNILLVIVLFTFINKVQAQQKQAIQLPDCKIGGGMLFKLKNQELGFSARYQLACGKQTSVVIDYSRGYILKSNEIYRTLSTSDFDLDAHYSFFNRTNINLYILGGFNLNTRKWTGFYNDSYLKNVDLWGGINAGTGVEYTVKSFTVYAECKTILFDQGIFGATGIMYHFHKPSKEGKIVKSRSIK